MKYEAAKEIIERNNKKFVRVDVKDSSRMYLGRFKELNDNSVVLDPAVRTGAYHQTNIDYVTRHAVPNGQSRTISLDSIIEMDKYDLKELPAAPKKPLKKNIYWGSLIKWLALGALGAAAAFYGAGKAVDYFDDTPRIEIIREK